MNELTEPTTKDRIEGAFQAVGHFVSGLVAAAPHLLESRDIGSEHARAARARAAEAKVRTTTIREIEDDLGIDRYSYPRGHRGYSTHPRNRRPLSRGAVKRRHERLERRLTARLARRQPAE